MPEGQGIDAGDAVLSFIADTTSMDAAFDNVAANTQGKLEPANQKLKEVAAGWQSAGGAATEAGAEAVVAGEEMEEAASRSSRSIREAKGEAGLLGEAFGVHLPRHVRSFVAELPGVSEALSAAFSATAILFIIEAVVQLTEKVTEFVSEHFIFTEEMKASTKAVAEANAELIKQAEAYQKAKDAVDSFGKDSVDKAKDAVDALSKSLAENEAELRNVNDQLYGHRNGDIFLTDTQVGAFENKQHVIGATIKALNEQLLEAQTKYAEAIHAGQLADLANQEKVALAYAESEQETFELKREYGEKRLVLLRQVGNQELAQQKALAAELEADLIKHETKVSAAFVALLESVTTAREKSLDAVKTANVANEIQLTPLQQALDKGTQAAHAMGVVLRSDLVDALERSRAAMKDFLGSGIVDPVAFKQFDANVSQAQKNLDNFGKSFDKLKLKGEITWKGLVQDMRQGVEVTQELGKVGEGAFNSMATGVEGAFAAAISGQKGFGQALEEATAKALISIAAQAAVKALFYTAEGFAELALGVTSSSASELFTAAGIMAGVAGAAGTAGALLSGASGGGGSSSPSTNLGQQNSTSNTTSQASGRVPHFGDGALVSSPTLAMIGERAGETEAVIPLDHPASLRKIGAAIAGSGGGGGRSIHVHVNGLVSPDNLSKVIGQIDKKVRSGGASLHSSNSFRITKRSA